MSESVTVQIPVLKPVTDPLELKRITMQEYAKKAHLAGIPTGVAAIEKFAEAELEIADAYKRESKRTVARAQTKTREQRQQRDVVADKAKELGHTLANKNRTLTPNIGAMPAHIVGEKWAHAVARIHRILENDGGTKTADVDAALRATAAPKLAREFLEVWWHYQMRNRDSRFNPYRGLNDRDASRKFMRLVEDICDKSTGTMGFWYIK